MKKVLITMALLASMVAGAMVLSSFSAPKQDSKMESLAIERSVPTYWEGTAWTNDRNGGCLNIKVYQSENACNSFYAVIVGGDCYGLQKGDEVVVRENPKYDPNDRGYSHSTKKYFITYKNKNFYFNM